MECKRREDGTESGEKESRGHVLGGRGKNQETDGTILETVMVNAYEKIVNKVSP